MATKRLRRRGRHLLDYAGAALTDLGRWMSGKGDRALPPLRLRFIGGGDFRQTGEQLARLLIDAGGLRASDRVLDIGCGVGRVAIPLTGYLDARGTYDGFDIVKRAVGWCARNITPEHPNFRFHAVDVANSEYRSRGAAAAEFQFPFADRSFDFVFAMSVFTHLVEDEMRRYIAESARVLAPGGRLLATFFLLNDHSLAALPSREPFTFPHSRGATRLLDADNPGVGVAIDEAVAFGFLRHAGLHIERIDYGQWSGRGEFLTFQDVVLARRESIRS